MKTLLISSAIAIILGFPSRSPVSSQEDAAWKKISMLQSTRSDVESLLGKSKSPGYDGVYDLEEGHLFVEYTAWRFCENGKVFGWNVPEGTVIEVTFSPNPLPQFSSLSLDLARFKKVRENPCCPDLITYRNAEEGVAYTVTSKGKLNTVEYFPSSQYDYLRCKMSGE